MPEKSPSRTAIPPAQTRASAVSHPSSALRRLLDPLCTRAKPIVLTTHRIGCEKDPARDGGIHRPGAPKVSDFVTVRLLREHGLDAARCRPLATSSYLPIYSPYPPDRQPVRGTAAADDFSVTWQLVWHTVANPSSGPRSDRLENGPIRSWRSSGTCRGLRSDDDRRDPSGESRIKNLAISRSHLRVPEGVLAPRKEGTFDPECPRVQRFMTRRISSGKPRIHGTRLYHPAVAVLPESKLFLQTLAFLLRVPEATKCRRVDGPVKITLLRQKYNLRRKSRGGMTPLSLTGMRDEERYYGASGEIVYGIRRICDRCLNAKKRSSRSRLERERERTPQ